MKKILFLGISCLFFSCSSEESITKESNYESLIITETTQFENFDNTGVNFTLTPIKRTKTTAEDEQIYTLDAVYPSIEDPIQTSIIQKFNKDGSYTLIHSYGTYQFATLYYSADGKILKIDTNEIKNTKGFSDWYRCVNNKYQELKAMIEKDVANEFACYIMIIGCQVLSAMAGVEHCS